MSYREGIGTTIIVSAVVIVLAIATISLVILAAPALPKANTTSSSYSTSARYSTPSTVSTESSTTYSTVSASGLQLLVMLNSSIIQPHGEVAAQVEALNTLIHNVTLPVSANQNISAWDAEDFLCSENPSHSLVGFALFKGQFTSENISAAGPSLQLAAPITVPCPYSLGLNETTFFPNSDETASFSYYGQTQESPYAVTAEVNATTESCTSSSTQGTTTTSCPYTAGMIGYWKPGFNYASDTSLSSPDFTYLPAGGYTIVAMDDWNQTLYAHFRVAPGPTTTTSSVASSDYWSEQAYMNASAVYAALGYPKVTYNDYTTPYLSSDPPFVVESSASTSSQIGTSYGQATSLSDSVQLAAALEKLNPSNYTLGEAVFVPGTVSNGTMTSYPQWFLYFAQITDGYLLLGAQGPYSLSIEVEVDALNGTAMGAQGTTTMIAIAGHYVLAVNSSTALEIVRTSSLPDVPAVLTQSGTVSFIEPRVVVPGQYATTGWIDPHLSGQSRLLWIIDLQEPNGEGALLGSFAVGAGTGSLLAGTSEQGYAP